MGKHIKIFVIVAVFAVLTIGGAIFYRDMYTRVLESVPVNIVIDDADTLLEEKKGNAVADCGSLGQDWKLYSSSDTPLSFCYLNAWGQTSFQETGISPEARTGTVYYVSFSRSRGDNPLVSYSTTDFRKRGDSDVPEVIQWNLLDFTKSDNELAALFPDEHAVVEKIVVNGKPVLKVTRDFIEPLSQNRITPRDYFMPGVLMNGTTYNLHVMGSPEEGVALETMLRSMVF